MQVLAGDIGGTKTAVAVVEISRRRLSVLRLRLYQSAAFGSLEEILTLFLEREARRPSAAGFGVAGPVRGGVGRPTKLPWTVDQRRVARHTGIRRVRVVNDFVAAALGIPYLGSRKLCILQEGEPEENGPVGLIGAGTGLGQAGLVKVGRRWEPLASEGGHADFGPRDASEDRLAGFVRGRFGRVSRDRLLSGEGLALLYDWLRAEGGIPENPRVARAFVGADRAAVISHLGLSGRDSLSRQALRLFVSIYGSEAGNLALQYRATGGLYVAGGIAPKILPALREATFLEAFRSKPPMEGLLGRVPVRVVLDARLPLFGAADAAYRTVMETTRPSSKTRIRRDSR